LQESVGDPGQIATALLESVGDMMAKHVVDAGDMMAKHLVDACGHSVVPGKDRLTWTVREDTRNK
jgi:hypothetical protein